MTDYYTPVNIFRNNAINVPKRNELRLKKQNNHWQKYLSLTDKNTLRKCSDEFNDYYTTKKLHSNFFEINSLPNTSNSLCADQSNNILVSTENKLKLMQINQEKLFEMQSITLPHSNTLTSIFLDDNNNMKRILSGGSDGVVNLIETSITEGNAKILRRFNHKSFLKSTNNTSVYPIRKLLPFQNDNFISIINDSIFIYNLGDRKTPVFLQSFTGLESVSYNHSKNFTNNKLLALSGSQFGSSGISLLDLTSNKQDPSNFVSNQYSPYNIADSNVNSYDCLWIDDYHIANTINDTVKIWDIRSNQGSPLIEFKPEKGYIQSLSFFQNDNKKTLYTSDDQNNIISWDLTDMSKMKTCILSQGLNSIIEDVKTEGKNYNEGIYGCGNIIINGNIINTKKQKNNIQSNLLMDALNDGSLLTLKNNELGLHQIKDVPSSIITNVIEEMGIELSETEEVHFDITLTSLKEASLISHNTNTIFQNESNNHSITTLIDESYDHNEIVKEVQLYNDNNAKLKNGHVKILEPPSHHNSDSIYSLNKLTFSGSTIFD